MKQARGGQPGRRASREEWLGVMSQGGADEGSRAARRAEPTQKGIMLADHEDEMAT